MTSHSVAAQLDGLPVRAPNGTWILRVSTARIECHGFVELNVALLGDPSYDVTLCVSESLHEHSYGRRTGWIEEALAEWLQRPDRYDGDFIDLV